MRRLSSQFTPIGLGKNNALLFTLEDAVRILQYALKNENAIAADQATFLAQNALEDVKSTSVEKKDTPKSQTQKNQAC